MANRLQLFATSMLRLIFSTVLIAVTGFGFDVLDNSRIDLPRIDTAMIRNAMVSENVNSRYTVERVEITGYNSQAISRTTRRKLDAMVGQKLNAADVERLASRIRQELHTSQVKVRIGKGSQPQQIAVALEIVNDRKPVDFNVTKLGFQSKEGLTGSTGIHAEFNGTVAEATSLNDADRLIERDRGFSAMVEREHIAGASPFGVRVSYGAMSPNWSGETIAAFGATPYRSRQFVEPELLISLSKDFQISAGISLEQLNGVGNVVGSNESANAITYSMRLKHNWAPSELASEQLEASYSLRSGAKGLGGDFAYNRHSTFVAYTFRHVKQSLKFSWLAGMVSGTAPLYDRFSAGNSTTLRGWNKYALAPLGGSRIVHGSVEYRFKMVEAFYDAGSLWDNGQNHSAKHSVGVGIRKDAMQLAVAFPLKGGRVDPVFIAGVNF